MDLIDEMPAADVQPVKRGRCVIDNEGYERCSVCNEHETGMRYFTFCPRCGAKLDGDDK
jgi:predicted amidophosphoribosyltransferase